MNNVEPIRNKQKIYTIKQYTLSDQYNERYRARDYLLFVFGINSALRISEPLSLRVKNTLTAQGEIKDLFKIRTSKTKKELKIFIDSSVKEALENYFEQEKFLAPNDHLFKTQTG